MQKSKLFPQIEIGQRIRLVSMGQDPNPMPSGVEGTVRSFSDLWDGETQVHVDWDADVKRSLFLILPHDKIEVLK